MKNQETHEVKRKNWNEIMGREPGEGYSFIKKKGFVCGSLSHLIKDCDNKERKWQERMSLRNKGSVQLNAGRPNINSVRPNINTGRTNVNSVRPNINSVRQNVNSVRTNINTVRSKQPDLLMIVEKQLVLEMLVDESLEMIVDEALKRDEEHFEFVIADCKLSYSC
ncbi:hypothetical protein Tco_1136480 [Tanacetum coccineum]